ncbi:MAG: indole-3-glycerol-phosphate synthase [Nitrospinae bacterium]|nr:indole-3-glycerol-phosphate synthase [Nitrospinota bacterium]
MMTHRNGDAGELPPLLKKILENKADEVRARKRLVSQDDIKKRSADAPPVRPFAGSVLACESRHKIIAEIKRFSPGSSKLRRDFDPRRIAEGYEASGAAALSVLADTVFFGGSLSIMSTARDAVSLPVLCKEFIIDPFQIYEARAYGADAVLLMVVNFPDKERFKEMADVAKDAGLEALLEISDEADLEYLPRSRPSVIINNRNFRDPDLKVDVATTTRLAPLITNPRILISASGIQSAYEMEELQKSGVDAFLIGGRLMTEMDPAAELARLLGKHK